MTPDADDLLLFARVAESGSFSRAAERVQLPKSTVSRRIAALEKRLGERLLQRTTRKLVITEFGQGVLDHARALSEEVDAALAFALSRQARPSGRLRVSMPGDFASTALERPLADFFAEPYLARGELQRILPDWCLPDADCWAVFPGRRLMPAKTRAFIDMMSRTMRTCEEAVDASAIANNAPPGRFRVG